MLCLDRAGVLVHVKALALVGYCAVQGQRVLHCMTVFTVSWWRLVCEGVTTCNMTRGYIPPLLFNTGSGVACFTRQRINHWQAFLSGSSLTSGCHAQLLLSDQLGHLPRTRVASWQLNTSSIPTKLSTADASLG